LRILGRFLHSVAPVKKPASLHYEMTCFDGAFPCSVWKEGESYLALGIVLPDGGLHFIFGFKTEVLNQATSGNLLPQWVYGWGGLRILGRFLHSVAPVKNRLHCIMK
jgi:hypothetical protein